MTCCAVALPSSASTRWWRLPAVLASPCASKFSGPPPKKRGARVGCTEKNRHARSPEPTAIGASAPLRATPGTRELPCRRHHDLDHLGRRLQPRLDARARRPTARHHPGVPHLVEFIHRAHVLQPDHGLNQL